MDNWFLIVVSVCILALFHAILRVAFPSNKGYKNRRLPPGPSLLLSNVLLFTKSLTQLELILRDCRIKYGPLITFRFGFRPGIFIGSQSLAHQVLVQKHGAVFSDRPRPDAVRQLTSRNQHNISSASYGPTWRLFRRNLASEILHPSRIKSFSSARQWVFGVLIRHLQLDSSENDGTVTVVDHFQFSMFCLLALMCFGDKLDENQVKEIERVQRTLLLAAGRGRFLILTLFPTLGKIFFRNKWNELKQLIYEQEEVLIPLIKARISQLSFKTEGMPVAYVDTLVNLQLPEEDNRNLKYEEMVALCSEFLNAGTDTTSSALQWIMANLVKYPDIQEKVFKDITAVVGPPPPPPPPTLSDQGHEDGNEKFALMVSEEDLDKMPYLKAVVLEGLRRHPPGHFVLPHKVTKDVEVEGYVVPKNATINFMVAEMGWDPKVWADPMEFKPERFLVKADNEDDTVTAEFDITGTKEIKMMPFGAGRRICPASSLAMLHLEFFIANLIWYFRWSTADGYEIDLTEKLEFTTVMKHPLRAHISRRNIING